MDIFLLKNSSDSHRRALRQWADKLRGPENRKFGFRRCWFYNIPLLVYRMRARDKKRSDLAMVIKDI